MSPPGTDDHDDDGVVDLGALAERIEGARFTTAFRGFEPREVHGLLAEVAAALRNATRTERDAPRNEVRGDAGRAMRMSRAEDEAAEILREARAEADRILNAAVHDANELRKEAATFREQARASVLESIRDANALLQRARDESNG